MARPPLPPRGYYTPTHMLFNSQIPGAVFRTWLQLRSLTWCGTALPALNLREWVDLTGIDRSTFKRHLNYLQKMDFLHWHVPEPGMVSITFNDLPASGTKPELSHLKKSKFEQEYEPKMISSKMSNSKMSSSKMSSSKMSSPPSLNPPLDIDSVQDLLKDSELKPIPQDQEVKRGCEGERESEGERDFPAFQNWENQAPHQPVQIYRSLTHLRLNQTQQSILEKEITDVQLWQATLEHWLGHGWNPRNLAGMLDLYSRGGPAFCRSCKQLNHRQVNQTAQDYSQAALDSLRHAINDPGKTG